MAPAEDPRTPEGTAGAGDGQSSPGPSALHGPRPSWLSSQGARGLQRTPRIGCPTPPQASVSPLLALSLSLTRDLTTGAHCVPVELEALGSKDCRQRLPDPGGSSWPGVRAPDRQGGPGDMGAALRALKAFLIHQLSTYSVSAFHLLSRSSQQRPGRRQPATKWLWLPHATARMGDRNSRTEADRNRQGRSPAQGRRSQAPAAPQAGCPLCPGNRAPRGRGRLGTRAPFPPEASPCALAVTPWGGEGGGETQGSHSSRAWRGPD